MLMQSYIHRLDQLDEGRLLLALAELYGTAYELKVKYENNNLLSD